MVSFVATPDKFMNEEYCNKVTDDVSLLKIGVIYGAKASGKSNVLKALSFFKQLMQRVPQDRWADSLRSLLDTGLLLWTLGVAFGQGSACRTPW